MLLAELVDTSLKVTADRSRKRKIGLLAQTLTRLPVGERRAGIAYLCGQLPQGRIGVGGAALRNAMPASAADTPTLHIGEVDEVFTRIASLSGAGSGRARVQALADLLTRATAPEQAWLADLVFGELRQGAQEGILVEAIAQATQIEASLVRRAAMVAGDLLPVALAALEEGAGALAGFRLQLFTPVQPMLAQTADGVEDALEHFEGAIGLDYKLDGARVQVHRDGDDVQVYTRQMNDVTAAVPEVVELARALPVDRLILDGEALALDNQGRPLPFQATMRRFGRRLDVDALRQQLPLSCSFFDCLHADGEDLLDATTQHRLEVLTNAVGQKNTIPHIVTAQKAEAARFLHDALIAGHEGVMAKDLTATYEAGRRGAGWLKIKPSHTLDLVVLAVEWGSGRRQGKLSNLHLGARDPATGGFAMLGKTFKGMTDVMLQWQTEQLLLREIGRDGHTVHVRPELVVEIAFDGVQTSPKYPAGLALRFARVKRYRPDKLASDADTVDTVRQIHAGDRLPL
ncbi:MAG: ATP-dependent DNA ligase [Gemmatimonadetes bacterium]|jgi:DNA ligase 1|nr:ATP-dependent DNA ligase [Gemmatimonadota bacterium]MBT7859052.1 ATP-dependent DNA ligase [Gemmatimonadota bacterium]